MLATAVETPGINHRFMVGGCKGYVLVGRDGEGKPVRVDVVVAKWGSTLASLINAPMVQASSALARGVPLEEVVTPWLGTSFEPSGPTTTDGIPSASSLLDYVAQWLLLRFGPERCDDQAQADAAAASVAGRVLAVLDGKGEGSG